MWRRGVAHQSDGCSMNTAMLPPLPSCRSGWEKAGSGSSGSQSGTEGPRRCGCWGLLSASSCWLVSRFLATFARNLHLGRDRTRCRVAGGSAWSKLKSWWLSILPKGFDEVLGEWGGSAVEIPSRQGQGAGVFSVRQKRMFGQRPSGIHWTTFWGSAALECRSDTSFACFAIPPVLPSQPMKGLSRHCYDVKNCPSTWFWLYSTIRFPYHIYQHFYFIWVCINLW